METILQEIRDERQRQDDKWGSQRQLPPYTWMTILMEEVGEAAQAALETTTTPWSWCRWRPLLSPHWRATARRLS